MTSLEGRDDAESRRVLLRVTVDRFVNDPAPSRETIAQFEESVAPLLAACDPVTRLLVARKLAPRRDAPASAIQTILAMGGEPALLVLERAVVVAREGLIAAASGEIAAACAVAKRTDLDEDLIGLLLKRPGPEIARVLACNLAAPIRPETFALLTRRAHSDKVLAHALLARPAAPIDQAPLFLFATSAQRTTILLAAQRAEMGRRSPPPSRATDAAERLERHSLARQPALFVSVLAKALNCDVELAERIVAEPSGEPLAVALAALDTPEDATMRILLLGDSPHSLDYNRLGALNRLKDALHPAAARRIIAAMVGAPAEQRVIVEPVLAPDAAPAPSRAAASGEQAQSAPPPHVLRRRRAIQFAITGRMPRE